MISSPTGDTGPTFNRRTLLAMTAVAGIVPAAMRAQEAEDQTPEPMPYPRPTVDARFPVEVASGVFLLADRRVPLVPNIGIVVGAERALIIDCGLGIDSGEAVLDTARRLAPGRELVLTVTHAHPEHGFGAQVFAPDAQVFYNAAQRDHLMASGQALLDGFRAGVLPAEHADVLDGIEITGPDAVYDGDTATIDLGGREVVLRNVGLAHSPGDQLVDLPEEGILFAGDLIEERIFPIVPFFPPLIGADDIDLPAWNSALDVIAGLAPRVIVPGHGNLGGMEIADDVAGYLAALKEVAATDASMEMAEVELRRRYPTWEQSNYIPPALQYMRR